MKERFAQFAAQLRQRTACFMAGRNGNDQFNFFLLIADVVLLLLASIFSRRLGGLLYPLVLVLLGYSYFRMLSRNLYKRRTENERFLRLYGRVMSKLRLLKERWVQRRDYKFFTCPSCKSVMRVPKGHGKIKIVCRKCGNSFTGKS
jgi:ribosomal protein L37AE/L43A